MKNVFGLMLMATMLLSASAVFADHAPPNQTADVSCFENQGSFADIAVISFGEVTINQTVAFAEIDEWCFTAQTGIAVPSGQGYTCSGIAVPSGNDSKIFSFNEKSEQKDIPLMRGLHKPGHNSIARL